MSLAGRKCILNLQSLEREIAKHERTRHASRRIQVQLEGFPVGDFQLRRQFQSLAISHTALSQEILRLRSVIDALNGVLRMIYDHPACGNSYNDSNEQQS